MKTKVITKQEFQPIVIELTIESEQELCDLWHRLEVFTKTINDSKNRNILKHKMDDNSCDKIYELVNEIVEQNNLKL